MDIQGDPELAALAVKYDLRPEPSRILSTDWLATAMNRETLLKSSALNRIVDLSCRHKVVTRNTNTVTCPRCAQLIRHGMDYEAWLRGVSDHFPYDGLHWRQDPCRFFNERTDLAGNFIDDPEAP